MGEGLKNNIENIVNLVNFLFDTDREKHIYRMCAYRFYKERILEENQRPFERTVDEIIYWANSKKDGN